MSIAICPGSDVRAAGAVDEAQPPGNGYPFIDIGNRFVASRPIALRYPGPDLGPDLLDLHNPSPPVAQGQRVGHPFTAAIRKMTNNQLFTSHRGADRVAGGVDRTTGAGI
jgi:hypothetical protein